MINVWRSEIRKLLRPRFIFSNVLVVIILQSAFTVTMYLKANASLAQDLSKSTGLFFGTRSIAAFLGVIGFCIFAANFAQEYGYGTLKNLLVRQPNRTKLMVGKIFALATFMAFLVLVATVIGIALSYGLAPHAHVNTNNWNLFGSTFLSSFGNVVAGTISYGVLGACLAVTLRSSITSISAGLIWFLVIETLFGFLGKSVMKWLPGGNLANFIDGGSADMSYMHSASVVCGYFGIAVAILLIIFNKRDVAN